MAYITYLAKVLSDLVQTSLKRRLKLWLELRILKDKVNPYAPNDVYILSGPCMKLGRPEAHPSLSQSGLY